MLVFMMEKVQVFIQLKRFGVPLEHKIYEILSSNTSYLI